LRTSNAFDILQITEYMTTNDHYEAVQKEISAKAKRWVLIVGKDDTEQVIDDNKGIGFRTRAEALKKGWYAYRGGKEKVNHRKSFWKSNKAFAERLKTEAVKIAAEMDIQGFDVEDHLMRFIPISKPIP